ncbi:MAG: inverse autotransporter beta domain-containing protein [Candidatus Omnitrophota bacterium]|nr:MAG: inverse autotransporter beta domain-containing protein [Candidatus Omnitrophota bacterium]
MPNRIKACILILLLLGLILFYNSGAIGEEGTNRNELPEWLKRIYYGLKIETDRKPFFYFETIQPLWRFKKDDAVIFTQPHITIKDRTGYYSLGLGYRRLLGLNRAILGFNVFFDYQEGRHHQIGLGAESLGDDLEARINYYLGTSHEKQIEETDTYFKYAEVVDGLDAEVGIRLPHLSWAKFFAGGYYYGADYTDDLQGWKARLELKPLRHLTLDIGVRNDNSSDERWFMEMQWRIPFGEEEAATEEAAPKEALYSRMLEPVERNFMPTLEEWTSDKTATVTGVILDQNGNPVINAKVEIHSKVVTVYTDDSGRFNATVPVGEHTLYAWNADGEQIISGEPINVSEDEEDILDVRTYNVEDPAAAPAPPANQGPVVSNILDQTINEGGTFDSINLDDYVTDPDDDDDQIVWTCSGNTYITVSILNRVATLTFPSGWSGYETITFIAKDPEGLSASNSATFTVNEAVNHAPEISDLKAEPYIIKKKDKNKSTISFDVSDADGDRITWYASVSPQDKGDVSPDTGYVNGGSGCGETTFTAHKHEKGTVTITIELNDGHGGTDSESINITIKKDD